MVRNDVPPVSPGSSQSALARETPPACDGRWTLRRPTARYAGPCWLGSSPAAVRGGAAGRFSRRA